MEVTSICWLTIREASDLLHRGELRTEDLLRATFDQIDRTESDVHAYVRIMDESAWRDAERADLRFQAGCAASPLDGIPISVKDLVHTRGFPTEAGSDVLAGFVSGKDAAVVARLRQAGAVLIGKTVTHEFAYGQDTPPTRNAWDTECYPGGSSAGSAVSVAVGSAYGAIGTDTGGSIRIPASLNGVVGLKPTHGRVSRSGVIPLSPTLDTVGPLTRTVEDCALVLGAIAGSTRHDPTAIDEPVPDYVERLSSDLRGFTVGVERKHFFHERVAEDVRDAVDEAIQQLASVGARIVEVEIDNLQYASPAGWSVLLAEASDWHHHLLRERGSRYVQGTRVLLELGELLLATSYIRAQRVRRLVHESIRQVFHGRSLDALVTPTTPLTTMPVEDVLADSSDRSKAPLFEFLHHAFVANVVGMPALTVPCGFSRSGLPIGMQFLGRPFDERTLFQLGYAYQAATNWHGQHPKF